MEGELRDRQFVVALRSIGRRRKTGILTVQGRDEIIAFSFSEGGIVGADALNQSLEEGLGGVLASQHLVEPTEFAALAAEHESGGGRVIDLLVERSFLSRGQLLESLRAHTYRLCLEALSWSAGDYRFYQGDEVAFESGIEPLGVGELLIRASLELGGAGLLKLPIPDLHEIYSRCSTAFDEADSAGPGAGPGSSSHRALELLDGRRTLDEVAASADFSPFDIRDLASEWLEVGIIEKTGERLPEAEVDLPPVPPILESQLPDLEIGSAPGLEPVFDDEPGSADAVPTPVPIPREVVEKKTRSPRPGQITGAQQWVSRVFGVGILAATLALLIMVPAQILLPFPWQGAALEELRAEQRSVQRLNIERGAHTFFLLSGRYPESLEELESRNLISASDLDPHGGGQWRITASSASFVLRTLETSEAREASWTSSVAGNFLLDPEFIRPTQTTEGPLLVLLD